MATPNPTPHDANMATTNEAQRVAVPAASAVPTVPLEIQLFLSEGTMPVAHQKALCVFMYDNQTASTPRGCPIWKEWNHFLDDLRYTQHPLSSAQKSKLRTKVQAKMKAFCKKMEKAGAVRIIKPTDAHGKKPKDKLEFASWCETWKLATWDGSLERPDGWDRAGFAGEEKEAADEVQDQAAANTDEQDWEHFDEPLPPTWIINEDGWVVKDPAIVGPAFLNARGVGYLGIADGIADEYRRPAKNLRTTGPSKLKRGIECLADREASADDTPSASPVPGEN